MRILAEDLRFAYGAHSVLDGVHLDEDSPGLLTALIGPNAAGKSTFLRCLAGLLRGRGLVQVGEHVVASLRATERTKLVCYLPQDLPNTAALPDPPRALAEWARVLRPGGRLVLVEGDWRSPGNPDYASIRDSLPLYGGRPAAELEALVRAHGFARTQVEPLMTAALWVAAPERDRYALHAWV